MDSYNVDVMTKNITGGWSAPASNTVTFNSGTGMINIQGRNPVKVCFMTVDNKDKDHPSKVIVKNKNENILFAWILEKNRPSHPSILLTEEVFNLLS